MNKKEETAMDIEALLEEYLKDDIPEEERSRLNDLVDGFEGPPRQRGMRKIWEPGQNTIRSLGWGFNRGFIRAIYSLSALLLIISGIYMQTSGPRSVLAESISSLGTYVLVKDRLADREIMQCTLRFNESKGDEVQYEIQWLEPTKKIVTLFKNSLVRKTIEIHEDRILVADSHSGSIRELESLAQLDIPYLEIVRYFLSPESLESALTGRWHVEEYQEQLECDRGIYSLTDPQNEFIQLVTIDLCSYLPVELNRIQSRTDPVNDRGGIDFSASFRWENEGPNTHGYDSVNMTGGGR